MYPPTAFEQVRNVDLEWAVSKSKVLLHSVLTIAVHIASKYFQNLKVQLRDILVCQV